MQVGQLVKSLAGRDKGKHYLVIGFDGRYMLLSDGQNRPINQPKKKNAKHLQAYRCVAPEIQEAVKNHTLQDTTVRNMLNTLLAPENKQKMDESSNTPRSFWLSSSHGG